MSMKAIKRVHRSQEGSVLLGVCCFLFLATGLVATILVLGSNHRKISQQQVQMEQAMYVAEAGMERGARFMESNVVVIIASATGKTNGTGSINPGTYTFVITRTAPTTYSLSSTGFVNGVRRTISLQRVYQPSYAEFALWSQTNGAIWYKSGEVFNGNVHSDDKPYFDVNGGSPWFKAAMTTGAGTYSVSGGTLSDVTLDQGLTMNSYQGSMVDVDFNSAAATSLKSIATSVGLVLDGNSTITFNGGTLSIINYRKYGDNLAHSYTPPNAENIIYIRTVNTGTTSTRAGQAYLTGGTVNGRLTIVTETNIYLQGNIAYASDPESNPNSDDALGLIAGADVWVDTMAPNNLSIDAAIMATGRFANGDLGSFGVINYNSGLPRGVLTVYGGIVQELRGAVGTASGGVMSSGYSKNYSYDSRFIATPPSYYPTIANKVEFSQWREGR